MAKFTHSVIICTQSRSEDLAALLDCLEEICKIVDLELIVVANSSREEQNAAIRNLTDSYSEIKSKQFHLSPPGLTRSRNLGMHHAHGEILTFLDDDTEVRATYFLELEKVFSSDPDIAGVAPFIETNVLRWTDSSKVIHQVEKPIRKPGTISKAGNFRWINRTNTKIEVSWLPGCAMSYRQTAVEKQQFRQELENGHTGGYALGEDADFSMRIGELGKLIGLGGQSVLHKLSPISRASLQKMELARGAWLAYWTRNFPKKSNTMAVLIKLTLNTIAVFFGVKSKAGLPKYNLTQAFLRINGFFSEKRNPKLGFGEKG